MIDRIAFARVMGGFADRIGRALAPETSEMYYDVLTAELDTAAFLAGARIVFRSHKYNTWPEPEQFIAAAKPADAHALTAAEMFETVLETVNQTQDDWSVRHAKILALGPVVERAFRACGGRREMECVPLESVPFTRRRFVEAFEQAAESAEATSDYAAQLANVTAPQLGEMEDGAALVVRGLAKLKSGPVKDFPPTGRDRAAGVEP